MSDRSHFPLDYAGTKTPYTFLPVQRRAQPAILCLYFVIAVDVLSAAAMFLAGPLHDLKGERGPGSQANLLLIAGVFIVVGCASLIARVVTVVFYSMWIHRASHSAHTLAPAMEFTPAWAVGWFFIPIMNLFKPYFVVKELWQVTDLNNTSGQDYRQSAVPGIILGWWLCYILSGPVTYVGSRIATDLPEIWIAGAIINALGTAIVVASGMLCIRIIRTITASLEVRNPNPE